MSKYTHNILPAGCFVKKIIFIKQLELNDDELFTLFIIYEVMKAFYLKLTKFIDTILNKLGLTTR